MPILQGELDFYQALENLHKMPKQEEFIRAREPNAAYVGGQGSGKSVSLCTTVILRAAAEPNGYSLVGRLNMPALETSTLKTFLEMVPEHLGTWEPTKKQFSFHNGHQVIFRHLDITDPKTVGHIKSMNLSAAYVDEATEVSEEIYFLLLGRLRRKTVQAPLGHIIRLASNPAGHDWIWRRFFDPERGERLKNHNLGITASTFDNPFLPEEYVQNMLNNYPADWADRFIYGNFSDFSDLVYKEYSEDTHCWDAMKSHQVFGGNNPPESWPVIVGIDIGSDIDPWAIPVIAVSPDGRLYQYAEVYGNCMLIADIAYQLKQAIGNRRVLGAAYDYSNRQCALELGEHDIVGTPAIKEVQPGLFKCSQYFHINPAIEHPFNPKIKGSPFYFISSACVNSRKELSAYKWAKDRSGNATGEPSHDNSHSPDGIRYAIHTFRPLPAKLVPQKSWENLNLDQLSREYWKAQDKIKDRMTGFAVKKRSPRTMQEWQKLANQAPARFKRPAYANYAKWN